MADNPSMPSICHIWLSSTDDAQHSQRYRLNSPSLSSQPSFSQYFLNHKPLNLLLFKSLQPPSSSSSVPLYHSEPLNRNLRGKARGPKINDIQEHSNGFIREPPKGRYHLSEYRSLLRGKLSLQSCALFGETAVCDTKLASHFVQL
jgi:hypothetical protein